MNKIRIDGKLAHRLVATQFPQWKNLSIQAVADQGWDNRTFRLGEQMLVRLPSAERHMHSKLKKNIAGCRGSRRFHLFAFQGP